MKLYLENDLKKIKNRVFLHRFLYILCFILIAICLTLGLVLSDYETQTLAMVVCSIINGILVLISIFFIAKTKNYRHFVYEYENLLLVEKNEIKCRVISVGEHPISLADKSMCYEIIVEENGTRKTLFLSEIFDRNLIVENSNYKFVVGFDYIMEIYNED